MKSWVLTLVLAGIASAQPAFEVASVKPASPDATGVRINTQQGKLTMANVPLRLCIQWAYQVQPFQISGGPGWLGTDKYDIVAKAEKPVPNDQMRLMLQTLLAERFKLTVHREMKESVEYALVVAKGGSKLHAAKGDEGSQMEGGRGELVARGIALTMLARELSRTLGRTVKEETGLNGQFDFTLKWAPEVGMPMGMKEEARMAVEPVASDPAGPSIFTAVQEQLGLKLESRKAMVEGLVIDRAEKASEN